MQKTDIKPIVMGILNVTPDSFWDGGKFNAQKSALAQIEKMAYDGALIIDVGGESTRPGSDPVTAGEEIRRISPAIEAGVKKFPELSFSIDTTKTEVAKAALDLGATIVNDVSGLQADPEKASLAASYGATLVLMHSKGKPKTMQNDPHYTDVVTEVNRFLQNKAQFAQRNGVPAENIILDPGIGFGKRLEHNLALLNGIPKLKELGYPVLIGASRKSMIGQILGNRPAEGRLAGTISVHYHALTLGASILRVHDVAEASDSIRIFEAMKAGTKPE
ncbi:MAG: dihydropteroate synthase [Balneolales bacterium]|nr:dihydropteroate synthase [Balneolales bacterium]